MSDQLCQARCQPVGGPSYRRMSPRPMGEGGCTRKATYTDGRYFYCAQHAKEPATVMAKASGKIRPDCRALATPKGPQS